jgi:pilus assembly protein CpaD
VTGQRKDKIMRHSLLILAAASSLAGCGTVAKVTDLRRGIETVHVPVVTRQDFAFDAAAPDGSLSPADRARLDGWFQGLALTYGDNVYVEGVDSAEARNDVARIAGRYGMLVADGGPVLAGAVASGTARVVVSRTRALVPNCPDWSEASQPNYNNHSPPNYGCAANSNLAAMIANPEDLIHGRSGTGLGDALTSTKAVESYRNTAPTGSKGLQDITTKGK